MMVWHRNNNDDAVDDDDDAAAVAAAAFFKRTKRVCGAKTKMLFRKKTTTVRDERGRDPSPGASSGTWSSRGYARDRALAPKTGRS